MDRRRLAELVRFVADGEGVALAGVDLAVVDEEEISRHNLDYLRRAGPTDVLSFDLSDEASTGLSAQLLVCGEVAAKQGPLHGQRPQRELMLYVVHGLLHLMGYEDSCRRGAVRMHAREEEILDAFENSGTDTRIPGHGHADAPGSKWNSGVCPRITRKPTPKSGE